MPQADILRSAYLESHLHKDHCDVVDYLNMESLEYTERKHAQIEEQTWEVNYHSRVIAFCILFGDAKWPIHDLIVILNCFHLINDPRNGKNEQTYHCRSQNPNFLIVNEFGHASYHQEQKYRVCPCYTPGSGWTGCDIRLEEVNCWNEDLLQSINYHRHYEVQISLSQLSLNHLVWYVEMENGDISVVIINHFDSFYFGFQARLEEYLLLIEIHRVVWSIQADVVFALLVFKLYMKHNLV